jgi:hypothetical protein
VTITTKPLIVAKYAGNAETTEYTVPAGTRTIVDKFVAYSAAGATLTVKIVPNAGTAGASNIIEAKTLAAGDTYAFPGVVGNVLEAGGFISVICSAATNTVIRASGREVT